MSQNQPQSRPSLSIIIPAYCEERRIGNTLDELAGFIKQSSLFANMNVEVLIVAADAPDKTHKIVKDKLDLFKNAQLLTPGPHVGKGRDVQYGMLQARGRLAVFMDADLATPLHHLQKFYESCRNGADLTIGVRNLRHYRTNKLRNMYSYLGNGLFRLISRIPVEDTQCGFKMFNQQARSLCFSKMTIMGWDFDIELLTIAKANSLSVVTLPVEDWKDMPHSTHRDGVFRIAVRMIRSYIQISVNRIRGVYGDPSR